MSQDGVSIAALRRSILDDAFKDFEHSRKWVRRLLEPLAWTPANRFAGVCARFDSTVARAGFREAMRELLNGLVREVEHQGLANVPAEGPLLIISNHPGSYDSVAIAASLPRDDLQIIATGYPLLRRLPNTSRHLIYMDPQAGANVSVARASVRHLQSGGALLVFPNGRVEPDPAILPGAMEMLRSWSPSVEFFLRKVPTTRAQIVIVSDVLSPAFLRNPLVRLWKDLRNPQTVAEVLQILTQMIFSRAVQVRPRISFGTPRTVDELRLHGETLFEGVLAEAGRLLAYHMAGQPGFDAGDLAMADSSMRSQSAIP